MLNINQVSEDYFTLEGGGEMKKTITGGACLWSGLGPLKFLDSCLLPHKTRILDTIPDFFSLSLFLTLILHA